jgi:hypothetical protein
VGWLIFQAVVTSSLKTVITNKLLETDEDADPVDSPSENIILPHEIPKTPSQQIEGHPTKHLLDKDGNERDDSSKKANSSEATGAINDPPSTQPQEQKDEKVDAAKPTEKANATTDPKQQSKGVVIKTEIMDKSKAQTQQHSGNNTTEQQQQMQQQHPLQAIEITVLPTPQQQTISDQFFSKVHMYHPDEYEYKLCRLENVCQTEQETIFYTYNDTLTEKLQTMLDCCYAPNRPCNLTLSKSEMIFCRCFTTEARLRFETTTKATEPKLEEPPAWMISQWLKGLKHHIAHFSYSIVQLFSILQYREFFSLPYFQTVLFQDASEEFNDYETKLWSIVAHGANLSYLTDFRFLKVLRTPENPDVSVPVYCFKSVYTTSIGEKYAKTAQDLDAFKHAATEVLGFEIGGAVDSCPPRKTLIITRKRGHGLRRIVNLNETIALLNKKGITNVDVVAVSEDQTMEEQAKLFSEFGLLISSHSSQLTNLLYAPTNAAVMEVAPMFKAGFRHLGLMSRLKYINSFGHPPPDTKTLEVFERVNSLCDSQKIYSEVPGYRCRAVKDDYEVIKKSDYVIDFEIFEPQLDEALDYLESVCQPSGGWIPKSPQSRIEGST